MEKHILPPAILCAMLLCVGFAASPCAGGPGEGLYRRIASLPASNAKIAIGQKIIYRKYPVSGNYPKRAFDSAAATMTAFLAKYGTVRVISAGDLDSCLSGNPDSCRTFRYCCMPLEIASISKEKTMRVGNFVKLDKNGDFVPSQTATTIASSETETRVRFVVIDLAARTIVFDVQEKRTGGGGLLDKTTAGKEPSAQEKKTSAVSENVLEIVGRITGRLRERFEGPRGQ